MHTERHVRFFRNGRNQAVRIPREFEMDAQEAIMRREDDRLIIEPVKRKGLLAILASLSALDEEFPDTGRDLLPLDDIEL
ncbi:AbrB/MazE/SpoVT family DNA-binding domain-containing protein [Acidithiobacillus sp.]|uniref:antitoxin n=1 Tax=Acidithiobacillus sp. TaxID=1872118 RepID=UPI002629BC11|nr:AbrB/MazE/SpoVT family DNA-binding domain-containing protein [Acidithiobacillus sp.]